MAVLALSLTGCFESEEEPPEPTTYPQSSGPTVSDLIEAGASRRAAEERVAAESAEAPAYEAPPTGESGPPDATGSGKDPYWYLEDEEEEEADWWETPDELPSGDRDYDGWDNDEDPEPDLHPLGDADNDGWNNGDDYFPESDEYK